MAWRLDGTYFENCSCEVGCPCTVADFSAPADYERCQFLMAFHVDSGKIDDVDVSGLTVGIFGDTPAMMVEGSWKVGLFMDAKASEQQGAKLASVFSGQMGGPMAGLAPLISTWLVEVTANPFAPAFYIMTGGALSAIAILSMKEYLNTPLE